MSDEITPRDLFAAFAMVAELQVLQKSGDDPFLWMEETADVAFRMADAMMAEREAK